MVAVKRGQIDEVRKLLYNGADPNLVNSKGDSALHIANETTSENPDITKLLISYGADVNLRKNLKKTPLHFAATKDLKKTVKFSFIMA